MSEQKPLVKGKGTYWEVRPGVYYYRHSLGRDPQSGKYRYSAKRKIETSDEADVRAALDTYKIELNEGISPAAPGTVAEAARRYHDEQADRATSALAHQRHGVDIDHIVELFGDSALSHLHPAGIEKAYAQARQAGRFSASELARIHRMLKKVLSDAVERGQLHANPAERVKVTCPVCATREALSQADAARLHRHLREREPEAPIVATLLMLVCGVRRGEVLGLTWAHFAEKDDGTGALTIAQQYSTDKQLRAPRSKMGYRILGLGTDMTSYLRSWKRAQRKALARHDIKQEDVTPIVHTVIVTDGTSAYVAHLDPNNFARWFRTFAVDAGFGSFDEVTHTFEVDGVTRTRGKRYRGLTPQMLRNTYAKLLRSATHDIRAVERSLGHSGLHLSLDDFEQVDHDEALRIAASITELLS